METRVGLARRKLYQAARAPLSVFGLLGLRLVVAILLLSIVSAILALGANVAAIKLEAFFGQNVLSSVIFACLAVLAASAAGESASGVFGGGVPEIRALYTGGLRHMNGKDEEDRIALDHMHLTRKALVAKWSSLVFAVASGLPVGREGPLIHIHCCAMAFLLATIFGTLADKRPLRAQFLLCAVSAGVATTFDTPIAASLYALEVIATDAIVSTLTKLLTTASAAILFGRLVLGRAGQRLDLVPFANKEDTNILLRDCCATALITGAVGGCVSVLFIKINAKARTLLSPTTKTRRPFLRRFAVAATVAATVAAWPSLLEMVIQAFHTVLHLFTMLFTADYTTNKHETKDTYIIMLKKVKDVMKLKSAAAYSALLKSNNFDDLSSSHDLTGTSVSLRLAVFLSLGIRELVLSPLALALPLTAGCVKPLYVLGSFAGAGVHIIFEAFGLSHICMSVPLGYAAFLAAAATCSSVTALSSAIVLLEMIDCPSSELVLSTLLAAFVARITAYAIAGKGANYYDVQADRKHYRDLPRLSYDILACSTVADACAACEPIETLGVTADSSDLERVLRKVPAELDCVPVVQDGFFLGAVPLDLLKDLLTTATQRAPDPSPRIKHHISAVVLAMKKTSLSINKNKDQHFAFDLRVHAHLVRNACVKSVADTMPCSDLFAYLQRADYAFVLADDRTFIGVLTRDTFITLAETKILPKMSTRAEFDQGDQMENKKKPLVSTPLLV